MKRLSLILALPLVVVVFSSLGGSRGNMDMLRQEIPRPYAQKAPQQRPADDRESSSEANRAESLSVPNPSAQQAGQAASSSSTTVRSQTPNDERNGGEFRYGSEPGQVSTVPGETANGVHGTVNTFGTGGKPIRIPGAKP